MHVQMVCLVGNGSRHEAPTDQAEQACGYCTARDGGGVKVRARLCRWHSGGESACRQASSGTCRWFASFATEAAMKLRLTDSSKLVAADPRFEVKAESRCALVSAAGTPVERVLAARHHRARAGGLPPLQRMPP